EASTGLAAGIARVTGGGQPVDARLGQSMGQLMGADFSAVRVHTDAESDGMCRSIQATAFTTGQDLFFRKRAYDPGTPAGQELIAHEFTHVVQQEGSQVRRKASPSEIDISSTSGGRLQRKFGFEIELPMLLTKRADYPVPSPAGGTITMPDLPLDPFELGLVTNLVRFDECHINVDHIPTLDKLFEANLDQYANERKLDENARASLKAATKQLMPHHASIVEVATKPWDETSL